MQSDEARKTANTFNTRIAISEKQREIDIQKLKTEQLEKEVKKQQQELTAKTLHIVRQAELLERFRMDVKDAMRHAQTAEKAIQAVQIKLQDLPISTLNWDEFEIDFSIANPGFINRLSEHFPKLSHMEIKVCMLLRVDMTSKAIANLLALSERTIEHHRLSIRKKIQLDGKISVQNYLSKI